MLSICLIHVLHFWFLISRIVFNLYFMAFYFNWCFLMADTWVTLHTCMLASILGFSRISIAYKQKFNAIYKQYKDDKIAIGISGDNCHECPFYNGLDNCWHWSGNVMKNVSVFGNENFKIIGSVDLKHILILFQMMKAIKTQWKNLST